MNKVCPKCGQQVADGDRFCHKCGTMMPETVNATIVPEADAPELSQPVQPASATAEIKPAKEKKKDDDDDGGEGCIYLILIVIAAVVLFFLNPSEEEMKAEMGRQYITEASRAIGFDGFVDGDNFTDEEAARKIENYCDVNIKDYWLFSLGYAKLPGKKKERLGAIGICGFVITKDDVD